MKTRQFIALLLCISFLFLTLAGCQAPEPEVPDEEETDNPQTEPVVEEEHVHGEDCDHAPDIDFDAAIATFPPDTVMMKADDLTITWAELYVFLFQLVNNLVHTYGQDLDWSEDTPLGMSMSDLVLDYSTDEAKSFLVYMYGAEAIDLNLSDEELDSFNEDVNGLIEAYGGKEELEKSLRENGGFYNYEVFERLFMIEYVVSLMLIHLYGEDAVLFPDESVEEYASENEYMMAMHILHLKDEDDEDKPLSEAEETLKLLNDYTGSANAFPDFFKELMNERSEDQGGLTSFPDGYLFQPSDMVEPFSEASAELEVGGLSDIVETVYGYHIILRLPLDYDATPISVANEGMSHSLRQLAALDDFHSIQEEWREALNIEFTPEYNSIDIAKIFKLN